MRSDTFTLSLLSSVVIHVGIITIASLVLQNRQWSRQEFLPINLLEVPPQGTILPPGKVERPAEIKKQPPPSPNEVTLREARQRAKTTVVKPGQHAPLPATAKEEAAKTAETKPAEPARTENAASFASGSRFEGGGSEAGAGDLFGKGDVGVVPGTGTAGGGGTAPSGLGRGSGAPGLPAQTGSLRTNREAKPIQTARAVYPPMALRAGLESDVTLRIEVDADGKVTQAEIIRSGGAGFDEEALKAVKQSRFEPAQRDGQYVAAEFTYIYRFRLQR